MNFRLLKLFLGAVLCLGTLPNWSLVLAADSLAADSLVPNGTFEIDADNDGWPDGWGKIKEGGSYEKEGDNHFLRLRSPAPEKMILLYQPVNIPDAVKALEISWKQRVSNLKVGKSAWFDARIMLDFKDAAGNKLKGGPGAPYERKNSEWQQKTIRFLVPEGAKMMEFMPTLFQVQSGTFDLDDIEIKPVDAAPLQQASAIAAKARQEKEAKEAAARQDKAAKNIGADGSIVSNGNFEADKKGAGWPDDWGKLKDGSYENENGNHFLRLKSAAPGQTIVMYRLFDIPAGWKAAELSWKQRISDLKPGAQPWFDARIMMEFKDAAGNKTAQKPSPPYSRGNTKDWVEKTARFLIPEGAVQMEFMPSLFQVQSGIFDLDDIALKQTDPAALVAAAEKAKIEAAYANVSPEAPKPEKWPQTLHVVGNKVLNKDGKDVWLQGANVVSLEFLVNGDHVLRSILVAVDEWKANAIRLPVKDDYWFGKEANDGGKKYREMLDAAITLAANHGAYTILDLHRFRAPQQRHADFWKDAATRYKNHPAVLFDLFNEPHGTSWEVWKNGGFVEDKDAPADEDNFLTPEEKALNAKGFHSIGMQALINVVRETGAKNIVLVGGLDWAYDLSGIAKGFDVDDKGGNGIIYSTHIYPWKSDWQNKVLVVADKYPILLGEVGASNKKMEFIPAENQEDAATWVPRVLGFIQKYKLHWTAWSMHPGTSPVLITGWDYAPTPEWGAFAKRALAGEQFPEQKLR